MTLNVSPSGIRVTAERHAAVSELLVNATCMADVTAAFGYLALHFGFRYFILSKRPSDTDRQLLPLVVATSTPLEILEEFDADRLLNTASFSRMLNAARLPVCLNIPGPHLCPPTMIELMVRHSASTLAAIPLRSADGGHYMMALSGDRPLLTLSELNELGMLTLRAFSLYERTKHSGEGGVTTLTNRETEVLRWASLGKTSVEIGQILTLSDHTVTSHLNSTIRKLDCVNRAQAVAKGLRLGLIE